MRERLASSPPGPGVLLALTVALTVALTLALGLAGCATSPVSTSPAAASVPTPSPSESAAAAASTVSASPSASPAVPVDPSLLAILPPNVSGQSIQEVPPVEADLVTDPSLVNHAAGLAVALGIDLNTNDFAYVAVIHLKPLVFSNAFYLSWRQSYDQGACSQSSGLKGTSTTTIGGREVFVGTCTGGARTYHVHLIGPDRLVSITSVGPADYGALVLAGLAP